MKDAKTLEVIGDGPLGTLFAVYWAVKNRLTAGNWYTCPPELGGESAWEAGEPLPLGSISPEKYFQIHPDWYALRFLPGMKAPGAAMVAVAEGKIDETRPAGD